MEEKRKPRWWLRILGVVVVLGLLAGAAELALRLVIPGIVASSVRDGMGLTPDHPVEVELRGSTLLRAVTGRVGPIEVTVPSAPLPEGIVASFTVAADSAPFDPSGGEIQGGTASVTIPAESLGSTIAVLTQGLADSGEVRGGNLVVGKTTQFFGMDVTLSVTLALSVEDGAVRVDPQAVSAAGFDLTADQIREFSGGSLDGLLTAQTVCVSDRLPAGITLTGLTLSSTGSVTVTADLAPRILADSAEQAPGVCSG